MNAPSNAPRRADLIMPAQRAREILERGYACRLATTTADGWPYVLPLLYVHDGADTLWVHTGRASGQLAANVQHSDRVCLVVDEPGQVYGYGRFECDSSLSYTSVMIFGTISPLTDEAAKSAFFVRLMTKYGSGVKGRPANFFPRLDAITVYAIRIQRLTGKEITLPPPSQQWPLIDRTRTPLAGTSPKPEDDTPAP